MESKVRTASIGRRAAAQLLHRNQCDAPIAAGRLPLSPA